MRTGDISLPGEPSRMLWKASQQELVFILVFQLNPRHNLQGTVEILRPPFNLNTRKERRGSSHGEVAIQVYFISHFISRQMGRKRQNKPLKGSSTQNASDDLFL